MICCLGEVCVVCWVWLVGWFWYWWWWVKVGWWWLVLIGGWMRFCCLVLGLLRLMLDCGWWLVGVEIWLIRRVWVRWVWVSWWLMKVFILFGCVVVCWILFIKSLSCWNIWCSMLVGCLFGCSCCMKYGGMIFLGVFGLLMCMCGGCGLNLVLSMKCWLVWCVMLDIKLFGWCVVDCWLWILMMKMLILVGMVCKNYWLICCVVSDGVWLVFCFDCWWVV